MVEIIQQMMFLVFKYELERVGTNESEKSDKNGSGLK